MRRLKYFWVLSLFIAAGLAVGAGEYPKSQGLEDVPVFQAEVETQEVTLDIEEELFVYEIGRTYSEKVEESKEFIELREDYIKRQEKKAAAKKAAKKKAAQAKLSASAGGNTAASGSGEAPGLPEGVSGTYLGQFRISHYTDAPDENGGYTCTATGAPITPGRTVAMKSGYLPYGTKIYIKGVGYRIVEDCGVGSGKIDVAVDSKAEAMAKGIFYTDVWVIS